MSESFDPYRKWLGIPPEEQPPNHYRLLGVPLYESDPDVIENAVHRQMSYVRTFQTGKHAVESQKILNELAGAKICLLSRSKKQAYDDKLRQAVVPTTTANSAPTSTSAPLNERPTATTATTSPATHPSTSPPPAPLPPAPIVPPPANVAPPTAAHSVTTAPVATALHAAVPTSAPSVPFAVPIATPAATSSSPSPSVPALGGIKQDSLPGGPASSHSTTRSRKPEEGPPPPGAELRPSIKPPKTRDSKAKHAAPSSKVPPHKKKLLIWVPVLTSLGGIVLVVVLVVAYVAGNKTDAKTTDAKTIDKQEPSALASANPMFGADKGRPKKDHPIVGSPPPKPEHDTRPSDEPKSSDREERIQTQLAAVREAFGKRDMSRLRMITSAGARPQRNPRIREQLEQTQILGRYLEDFWRSANRGVLKIQKKLTPEPEESESSEKPDAENAEENKKKDKRAADEEFESPVKVRLLDRELEVSEVREDVLVYRVDGQEYEAKLHELPSLDAAAIAAFALKKDDLFGRVYVAAFLCVDGSGNHEENLRAARQIADEIEEQNGSPFPYLRRELEIAAAKK